MRSKNEDLTSRVMEAAHEKPWKQPNAKRRRNRPWQQATPHSDLASVVNGEYMVLENEEGKFEVNSTARMIVRSEQVKLLKMVIRTSEVAENDQKPDKLFYSLFYVAHALKIMKIEEEEEERPPIRTLTTTHVIHHVVRSSRRNCWLHIIEKNE
ncbi:hypothetical protein OSB04_007977 [Centaurea solstitialis]|uniref:Uncharacterized protein n=1 Tax=Centaurea solstitialis TaxID=347529 RepID=A0AA38WJ23_9ASTR|nr:hypothetical protein OSB04_007977 [Centaurea solstitialis]